MRTVTHLSKNLSNSRISALVTGASRGLGRALAVALAREGAYVLCHARRAADAEAVAAETGGTPVAGDLASAVGRAGVARQVLAAATVLDLLVHNAAVNPRPEETLAEMSLETFRAVQTVNVEAPVFLTQALLEPLRAAGSAQVILVSSEAGQFAGGMGATGASYRMSKAALNAFALVAAQALAADGIRVNAIHPGWVRTDMGGPHAPVSPEDAAAAVVRLALRGDAPSGTFFDGGEPAGW